MANSYPIHSHTALLYAGFSGMNTRQALQALQQAVDSYMAAPTKMTVEVIEMDMNATSIVARYMAQEHGINEAKRITSAMIDATAAPECYHWTEVLEALDAMALNAKLDFANLDAYILETEQGT